MIIQAKERSIFLVYLPVNPSLSFFDRIPWFLLFKRVVLCLYQSSLWQSFFKQKAYSSSMIKVLGAHNTIEKWLSAADLLKVLLLSFSLSLPALLETLLYHQVS